MKKHFGKQVIERPRRGSRTACSAKARHYGKITNDAEGYDYDGFTHFPVSRKQEGYNKRLGYKSFSDLLGPLNKYLKSSCGRPWDDVYSEIARELGRSGSEGIRHIKDSHIDVAVNTYRAVDGNVYECSDYGIRKVGRGYRNSEFYVEPETGILRQAIGEKYVREVKLVTEVPVTTNSEYKKIDNIWYFFTFDRAIERKLTVSFSGRQFYSDVDHEILISKRQLNKRELKEFYCFAKEHGYNI